MLKTILWTIMGLCFNTLILANGVKVPVICPASHGDGGIFVGAEALYWQPSTDDLAYAGILQQEDENNADIQRIDPHYDLGFSVFGGYFCPKTHLGFTIAYTSFHKSETDSVSMIDSQVVIGPKLHPTVMLDHTNIQDVFFQNASSKVDFDYDAIDVLITKKFYWPTINLCIGAGLRYADLDVDMMMSYDGENAISHYLLTQKSRYEGIGPRLETKARYSFIPCWGIKAAVGTSLLIGDSRFDEHHQWLNDEGEFFFSLGAHDDDIHRIVPEVDATLALQYQYKSSHPLNTPYSFSLEAGWKVVNYFNARETIQFLDDRNAVVYSQHLNNISFHGPYAGFYILAA